MLVLLFGQIIIPLFPLPQPDNLSDLIMKSKRPFPLTRFSILGLVLIAGTLVFSSCNQDDSDENSDLNGVWIESLWETMTVVGADTTWTLGEYIGDGYCCDVTTVNVTGNGFTTGETVSVDGNAYEIIEHSLDPNDLDMPYVYQMNLEIVTPFNGSKTSLELFKRDGD